MPTMPPQFIPNPSLKTRQSDYIDLTVDTAKIIQDWSKSVFSYEWLTPDGDFKGREMLSDSLKNHYNDILDAMKNNIAFPKPVLGIGMMDHVEIGMEKPIFMVLASLGVNSIPVHIPKTHEPEFTRFKSAQKDQS